MSWCGSRDIGLCLLSFNPSLFSWQVGQNNAGTVFLSSPLPFIDPYQSSKMWINLLVLIFLARFYYHDMSTKVPWNQNPFSACLCSFGALCCFLDSTPLVPVSYYGEWIKGRRIRVPFSLTPCT
jgi:hypothetical protein